MAGQHRAEGGCAARAAPSPAVRRACASGAAHSSWALVPAALRRPHLQRAEAVRAGHRHLDHARELLLAPLRGRGLGGRGAARALGKRGRRRRRRVRRGAAGGRRGGGGGRRHEHLPGSCLFQVIELQAYGGLVGELRHGLQVEAHLAVHQSPHLHRSGWNGPLSCCCRLLQGPTQAGWLRCAAPVRMARGARAPCPCTTRPSPGSPRPAPAPAARRSWTGGPRAQTTSSTPAAARRRSAACARASRRRRRRRRAPPAR